ncbi:MAG: HlyC/CorC family transporter [Ruminococcaceae bacterium]|nr:HlyC/CorC family transporter [Oscillospiraceae bacterium]
MDYIGPLLLQVVLIALNAIFASAETAFLSLNSAKIEKMVEEGDKKLKRKAKRLQKLTKDSSKFLSTIQVAITLAGFLGSAFAADSFAEPLTNWFNSLEFVKSNGIVVPEQVFVILITLILSFFSIVLGELVPKRIAMKNAEKVSLGICGFIRFMSYIFAPFVWVLTKTTNGMLRLFGINPHEEEEAASEEEIRIMLDTSSEAGAIDSMENEMIQNIFEFDDILISEVCTHRRDVKMVYRDDSLDEWKKVLSTSRHGYYPICGESADDIVAVLNIKKFFRAECKTVAEAMRVASEKPYFVPENMKADILFSNMKETRNYFAIVVDEYGGTNGVITIHDLLELLVGDMDDKDEIVVEEIVCLNEETREWKILGSASLTELADKLDITFDTEDCDTFGGYIFGILGEIPDDGTTLDLETDDLIIKVESVLDHRIESTLVTVKEKVVDEDDEDLDDEDEEKEEKKSRKEREKDAEKEAEEKAESEAAEALEK